MPGYLGVVCIDDISANENLLAVPNEVILSVQNDSISEIGFIFEEYKSLFESISQNSGDHNHAIYLLYEFLKGCASR